MYRQTVTEHGGEDDSHNANLDRHAYLIICHGNWNILKYLCILLDDKRNDLYIHVDKKAKYFPKQEIADVVWRSRLVFIPRISVNWGGYSQIQAELNLLAEATKGNYRYYHLLSGVDMPLKTQDEIHAFFDQHDGENFLNFSDNEMRTGKFLDRVQYFHFLRDIMGKKVGVIPSILGKVESYSLLIQQILKVNRIRNKEFKFYKGGNWFSITHELALYVLSIESFIRNNFRYTLAADEVFLHTVAMNSSFATSVQGECLRMTDWKRGKPYTFRSEDFELLIQSGEFWARKFDEKIDFQIVQMIYDYLSLEKNNSTSLNCENTNLSTRQENCIQTL